MKVERKKGGRARLYSFSFFFQAPSQYLWSTYYMPNIVLCTQALTVQGWTLIIFTMQCQWILHLQQKLSLCCSQPTMFKKFASTSGLCEWGLVTSFKPIRYFNPPEHDDWLEMGTWFMPGQSGPRSLESGIFTLTREKRSLFLFLAGVLRISLKLLRNNI